MGVAAINGGVEVGVVVHLELAVDFEAAAPGQDVVPELVEAGDQVVALLAEKGQALAVAVCVAGRGIWAVNFFLGMEEPEREDGETVDDKAGGFGVQLSRSGRAALRAKQVGRMIQKQDVALFGEVVAALVVAVDRSLDLGDVVVGGAGIAGAILGMPEVEIGAVLVENGVQEIVGVDMVGVLIAVPEGGRPVVEAGDFEGGEMEGVGHGVPGDMVEQRDKACSV